MHDVRGSLRITSELHICASCNGVISQFKSMLPNIDGENRGQSGLSLESPL
ncbi:deaminase domain-containing protein [Lysobacter capsici]|uniref:deaminase domain-containing protein n=1 Tax=Lysobacter capsici TaxID=435897 RepID=UPI003CCD74A3